MSDLTLAEKIRLHTQQTETMLAALDDGEREYKPFWRCEECGHEDHAKPMPANRDAFYAAGKAPVCKRCKSEAMTPIGW